MEFAFRWFLLFVVFGHCGMGLLAFVHVHASFGVRNPSTPHIAFIALLQETGIIELKNAAIHFQWQYGWNNNLSGCMLVWHINENATVLVIGTVIEFGNG